MIQIQPCRYGTMMFPDHDVYIGRSLAAYGEWSEGEASLFRQLLRPGDVAFDVGANLGPHTLCMAREVGARGVVLALEPQRMMYYFLCGNVALNKLHNVVCHQKAVGEAPGVVMLPEVDYTVENNFGGLELDKDFGAMPKYPVQRVRMDDFPVPHCRLIKADVEGMERDVLAGGRELIHRTRPYLYLEDDRAEKSDGLHRLLGELNYRIYVHHVLLFNPGNFREQVENVFGGTCSQNLFCHPVESPCPVDTELLGMSSLR